MGNFRLFQQARCEAIVKYTNCNLLEHECIRTGIRTVEAQIDAKNKKIKQAWQNVTNSYKNRVYCGTFRSSYSVEVSLSAAGFEAHRKSEMNF